MKIFLSHQIREADAFTIQNEPISSIDLMERASNKFVEAFLHLNFPSSKTIKIFSGMGNNGGDGLAISRILHQKGYTVETFVVKVDEKGSEDFETNLKRLSEIMMVRFITANYEIPAIDREDIVIDALFGTGLSRTIEGVYASVIRNINTSLATVVAVDMPSGLFSDMPGEGEAIVNADYTLSFQVPKLAFFMPENETFVGKWKVLDINLHPDYFRYNSTSYFYVDEKFALKLLKLRGRFSHKGTFGRGLLIAGSKGKIGAAVLSARACLRAGIGLLTVQLPGCGYEIMQTAVPEAMVILDTHADRITDMPENLNFDAVGIGPGLGIDKETVSAFTYFLKEYPQPLVIDADGLNIIAFDKHMMMDVSPESILTPHPKEFQRIAGEYSDSFEKMFLQRDFSIKYKVYIVLKGAYTSISTPDGDIYFNSTGNPGMATGGSGDVLTGVITSLLAQGYSSEDAAILGVYVHGLAGDLAAEEKGYEGLIASDIVDYLPRAFKKLLDLKATSGELKK